MKRYLIAYALGLLLGCSLSDDWTGDDQEDSVMSEVCFEITVHENGTFTYEEFYCDPRFELEVGGTKV